MFSDGNILVLSERLLLLNLVKSFHNGNQASVRYHDQDALAIARFSVIYLHLFDQLVDLKSNFTLKLMIPTIKKYFSSHFNSLRIVFDFGAV